MWCYCSMLPIKTFLTKFGSRYWIIILCYWKFPLLGFWLVFEIFPLSDGVAELNGYEQKIHLALLHFSLQRLIMARRRGHALAVTMWERPCGICKDISEPTQEKSPGNVQNVLSEHLLDGTWQGISRNAMVSIGVLLVKCSHSLLCIQERLINCNSSDTYVMRHM